MLPLTPATHWLADQDSDLDKVVQSHLCSRLHHRPTENWLRRRELHPKLQLMRLSCYYYTTPLLVVPLGLEPRSRANLALAVYKAAALPLSYRTTEKVRSV